MHIQFCGADREVTGSCHLFDTGKKKILVDCGMFQGSSFSEKKNHDDFPFDAKEVDVLLVTHAHLDHVGRIPKLIKDGFQGKIYMTKGTCELAPLIWKDAYYIMEYNNRKFGNPILFSEQDVAVAESYCKGIDYNENVDLGEDIIAVFKEAGHIFGAAFIEVAADGKKICFSGDIGNEDVPILKDTQNMSDDVDILLCESTYGNRVHESVDVRRDIILNLIKEGAKKGGTIMVPAFSLERTQEFLYELNKLSEYDETLPNIPIFLDSPLAIKATKVYKKYPEYYDVEAAKLHGAGDDFLDFPQLQLTYSKRESQKINHIPGPKMVIAGAGMMNGGRILHHAIRYLSDSNSTLIIVGYQANGTLGRKLYEGSKHVKVMRDEIDVHCTVKAIGALSAHGDQKKLLKWVGTGKKNLKEVYCIHGEPVAATELAHRIKDQYKVDTFVPGYKEIVEI
ncbi:MBL fold metallo-hydrolase [Candidatus Parcubacteria bacterium]|jgi:metallo-beta-lactamase family protein|nr:MBL fold metallo-hydrolase [Candidatus Parcubacteria bacterium]MBT3948771.1 MBL fold metallo-hydrolase [Candidatus Parcubacteria bacterium]